jgi:hypothetical protein
MAQAEQAPRDALRFLAVLRTAPRLATFVARSWLPGSETDGMPRARPSLSLYASVALDEIVLSIMQALPRIPHEELGRIVAEATEAAALFEAEGWLDDPSSFHRAPPDGIVDRVIREQRWTNLRFERLSFESAYAPHTGVPGAERWTSYERNRRARAWMLRHRGAEPRPWLVCLHGYGRGMPNDMYGFRSRWFHREFGMNVIHPVFPLHGPRRAFERSGDGVLGPDAMNTVHGFSQQIWDLRRMLSWIRSQGATSVAVHGVSLGAYSAALLATMDAGLDAVIAGIPMSDVLGVMTMHTPRSARRIGEQAGMFSDAFRAVHKVVSPLAMAVKVPQERLHVYAGLGDRMATPAQAKLLVGHWEKPNVLWYQGSHIGHLWSAEVWRFVREVLEPFAQR